MDDRGQGGDPLDIIVFLDGRTRRGIGKHVALAPAGIDVESVAQLFERHLARCDIGGPVRARQTDAPVGAGHMVDTHPGTPAVSLGLGHRTARVGGDAVGQGPDDQPGPGLPGRMAGHGLAGQVEHVLPLAEGGLALHRRLGTDIAIVQIVVRQRRQQAMPGRRRMDRIPIEIGSRRGADGQPVEAGVAHIGQAEGTRVGGDHRAHLEQVHHDDVGVRIGRRRGHQAGQQRAVEGRRAIVRQWCGRQAGPLVELRRQTQLGQVGDQDGARAAAGDAIGDEGDVGRRTDRHRAQHARRIDRTGRDGNPLQQVVGPAQDADQIPRSEGAAGPRIGQQLVTHARGEGGTVRTGPAVGIVGAAGYRGSQGGSADGEAQQFGKHGAVREPALEVGRRGR